MTKSIDLLHPEIRKNPYPLYARLRREAPVCQVEPGGLWAVSRQRDAQHVLKNPQMFSSAGFRQLFEPSWITHNPLAYSIVTMDPPDHTQIRTLVSRGFTSQGMAALAPRIRGLAIDLAERLQESPDADFLTEVAVPLPACIIADILGLDPALHRRFKVWGDALTAITPAAPSHELITTVNSAITEMESYLREAVSMRRRQPHAGSDLVTALIGAEIGGRILTDDEIVSFLFLLLPAGFETTTNLLASIMLRFTEHPEEVALLRQDPALIPGYVDEVMRYDAPVHGVLRMSTQDCELAGVAIPQGAMVVVLTGSANRDESAYPDPDRFDPRRGARGGMAFGHGIHFCLGAALARIEATAMVEALVERFSHFQRTSEQLDYNLAITVRGPLSLPIRALPLPAAHASAVRCEHSRSFEAAC